MNFKNTVICGLLMVYTCFSAMAEQGLALRKFRETGDSLDLSIQQELNRAVDLGVRWIKTKQSKDGSWGVSNKVETTALCALGLASQNDLTLTNTLPAALQYLKNSSQERASTNFPAVAWTAAVLLVTDTAGCAAETTCNQIKDFQAPLSCINSTLRREMILGLRPLDQEEVLMAASQEHYDSLAHQLDAKSTVMLQMWLDARVINRVGKGQLLNTQGQRVDWRRIFAREIISTQKIDPLAGGYWLGVDDSQILQNTALAILISKEL